MTSTVLSMLAQPTDFHMEGQPSGPPVAVMVVYGIVAILMVASMWKLFTKAGEPGWAAIVPIYNTIVLCKIAGKPWWWFILLCIPIVGFICAIIVFIELAKRFGKGVGYAVGLLLLGVVFFPMLAFGSAQYNPNAA